MSAPTVIETLTLQMLTEQQRTWKNICYGWEFSHDVDEDPCDRTRKFFHYAVKAGGEHHVVHWSPYSHPDWEDRAMLIAVGFGSGPRGNWDKDSLRAAIAERVRYAA